MTGNKAAQEFLFQSTLLIRGATTFLCCFCIWCKFQSTLLIRGATRISPPLPLVLPHFNPRSSYEERPPPKSCSCCSCGNFNPRSSYEERHAHCRFRLLCHSYFNPHSSYEERRGFLQYGRPLSNISIHAPHTRSDCKQKATSRQVQVFQSTLLIRGATRTGRSVPPNGRISIHAPHTRSDKVSNGNGYTGKDFNPRSSYEERLWCFVVRREPRTFQSTLLIRGATRCFRLAF